MIELHDNLDNLWAALTLLMGTAFCSLLIYVIKQHLTKNHEMFRDFTSRLESLIINDAVQDEKIQTHEGRLNNHDAEFKDIKDKVYTVRYDR